jgi:hypothetical protein
VRHGALAALQTSPIALSRAAPEFLGFAVGAYAEREAPSCTHCYLKIRSICAGFLFLTFVHIRIDLPNKASIRDLVL